MESNWKAGNYAAVLPDPVPTSRSQPGEFMPGLTAEQWLRSVNPDARGIRVVFTDDPNYNCGLDGVTDPRAFQSSAAGCYNSQYPNVLFVYWGPDSTPERRAFVVAHEFSHQRQWWVHFDVTMSAAQAGLANDARWRRARETDATCRAVSWRGVSAAEASRSASPCTASNWSEDWLRQQAESLGVKVQAW